MTSKAKWLIIPLLMFLVSLGMFFTLLGSAWAVACAPFVGIGAGMFMHGLFNAGVVDSVVDWMNKDS